MSLITFSSQRYAPRQCSVSMAMVRIADMGMGVLHRLMIVLMGMPEGLIR